MENSTFKSESANQKYIISLGASTSQDYKNIVFKNNVFYCPEGKVNQFGLFVGSKAGMANCVLENNTFVNLETATTGMVYVDKLADISVRTISSGQIQQEQMPALFSALLQHPLPERLV